MRSLAKLALEEYGIERAELKFINYSGNGLYQVNVHEDNPDSCVPSGRYSLRLHQPNYMKPEYISSEMEWLTALNDDGIDVPKSFRNITGEWITIADGGYEVPQARKCTLISWVDGRFVKTPRPTHFRSLGRMVGVIHDQSVHWRKPKNFKRPHWDWEGLFGDGFNYGFIASEARNAIPKKHQEAFRKTLSRVEEVQNQLGKGKKVYGLMHADLAISDNMVYRGGQPRLFDFDDCGFAYWAVDLGVLLAHYMLDFDKPSSKMREELIEGYKETSPLPESNLEYVDLFIAARLAQLMVFYQGPILTRPELQDQGGKMIDDCAKQLNKVIKHIP
jgi:Ser/Thr protein kinase RdoA (MazF antagonist)